MRCFLVVVLFLVFVASVLSDVCVRLDTERMKCFDATSGHAGVEASG